MSDETLRWTIVGLRVALLALGFAFLLRHLRLVSRTPRPPAAPGPYTAIGAGITLVLLGILGYQAYWQLAGFHDPRFVAFMHRYSLRPGNPRSAMARGRIVDQQGVILAESSGRRERKRIYPLGPAAAHVTGYYHARYAATGIERANDTRLRGASLRDRAGLKQFGRNLIQHRQVRGTDCPVTVHAALQNEAHQLFRGYRGAAVAVDVRTGAIRLLYSAPSFDPADPGPYLAAPASPMLDRAARGLYPPGSTYKVLIAAAAIEQRVTGRIPCPAAGYSPVAGARPIRDHEYYEAEKNGARWRGHGRIDLAEAFRQSANTWFAQAAVQIGQAPVDRMAARFFLRTQPLLYDGEDSDVRAGACVVPAAGANLLELAQLGIGQGSLLVTPLHMAAVTAAVANDGVYHAPTLQPPGESGPAPGQRVLAAATARTLQKLMRDVVERGTGSAARRAPVPLAGKTGTAQAPGGEPHGWFVCYAPAQRPQLAFAVIVERSGYGARVALPIAVALAQSAAQVGLIKP